jgi:hypothetical protein
VGCIALIGFHLAHGMFDEVRSASGAKPALAAESSHQAVGSASCSARGCHGSVEPWADKTILRNEYTSWLHNDPHAGAFRALSNATSLKMAELLKLDCPPSEHKRCLACHVTPGIEATARVERHYGVGCESCHSPAKDWLTRHSSADWKDETGTAKRALGMTLTNDPRSVAEQCVTCHVGGSNLRDVNHDLIAAGHPRLNFEFTAYLDNLPKHWKNKPRSPNQKTAAYVTGQLVAAQAALELLALRAEGGAPWPEFAEYDCFSCHHDLHGESWRRQSPGRRGPGGRMWSTWYTTMPGALGELLEGDAARDILQGTRAAMESTSSSKQDVVREARWGVYKTDLWLQSPKLGALGRKEVRQSVAASFLRGLNEKDISHVHANWDALAQLYLALSALDRADGDARIVAALKALEQRLAFPGNIPNVKYESPKGQELSVDALVKILRPLTN